jgi:hypothetical protein
MRLKKQDTGSPEGKRQQRVEKERRVQDAELADSRRDWGTEELLFYNLASL